MKKIIVINYACLLIFCLTLVPSYGLDKSAFFLPWSIDGTRYVDIKTDSLGGQHVAFGEWQGDSVFYGYCTANCEAENQWEYSEIFNSGVEYGSEPSEIQLQLDPENKPRIGFEVNGYSVTSQGYYYAECDENCLDSTQWVVVNLAEAGETVVGDSRWFKLNHKGQPRMATIYSEEANYLGDQSVSIFYHACDSNCLDADNWESVLTGAWPNLGMAPTMKLSLGIDSNDMPHMAVYLKTGYVTSENFYATLYTECVGPWDVSESWSWIAFMDKWNSSGFDLTIDSEDRLHLAGSMDGTINYSQCEDNCLEVESWESALINGLTQNSGGRLNLIVDEQNTPHMAYTSNGSGLQLDYLFCESGCDSPDSANWAMINVDDVSLLEPYFYHSGCEEQQWLFEGPVSLALSSSGKPFFGYGAANWQGPYCVDPNISYSSVAHKGRIGSVSFEEKVPAIQVDPASIHFDPLFIGLSSTLTVTVSNQGQGNLVVSAISLASSTSCFSLEHDTLPITIEPGNLINLPVTYSPQSLSTHTETLEIISNDSSHPVTSITLEGTGAKTPEPYIAVTPPTLDFGSVRIGSSTPLTMTIENTGDADLDITSASVRGENSNEFSIESHPTSPISPGNGTELSLLFSPTTEGDKQAIVLIASNDPNSDLLEIPVSANGVVEDDQDGDPERLTWFRDEDNDGFGDADQSVLAETQPDDYVSDNSDCDDLDSSVFPGAEEIPDDGIDQDCDGRDSTSQVSQGDDQETGDETNDGDGGGGGGGGCFINAIE